jgi:quinol monooxygenase YgiN
MAHVVAARWTSKPGREQELLETLRTVMVESRAEPGTQLYQVSRSVDDSRVFFLFEIYDDEAAYEAHNAADRFKAPAFAETIAACVESRERAFYETVGE